MTVTADDIGLEGIAALVPGAEAHRGRLADDGEAGFAEALTQLRDQMRRAETAHLLVIGESQMDRRLQRPCQHVRHQRQGQRDEALHVRGAAAIELAVAPGERERIAAPRLVLHRHHVGMAGQHDAAGAIRADGGPQIGLRLAVRCRHQGCRHAKLGQIVADPLDQRQVALRRDRGKSDQPLQDVIRPLHLNPARTSV